MLGLDPGGAFAPLRDAADNRGTTPFRPRLFRIASYRDETPDVRTFRLEQADGGGPLRWRPGQFVHVSVFGTGEAVFTLAGSPSRGETVEITVRAVGKVTEALRGLGRGDLVGLRGPYGTAFPVDEWRGSDLAFVGGGIGMAALRAPLQWALDHRDEYGEIVVLNGARTVADLAYKDEMSDWGAAPGTRVVRAVDPGGESPGWDGEVGLVPQVFERLCLGPQGRFVVTCGPPVMLHSMFLALGRMGYAPERVVTTLENKMKCGLGLCGRCNVGRFFVCTDGPVVTWARLRSLPEDL